LKSQSITAAPLNFSKVLKNVAQYDKIVFGTANLDYYKEDGGHLYGDNSQ